jgi:hypothetical protein
VAVLVYLDFCCLKRPFDDQRSPRIQLETTAIAALIAEEIEADWLANTDDQLIALGRKHRDGLHVAIANPIHVLERLTGGEP